MDTTPATPASHQHIPLEDFKLIKQGAEAKIFYGKFKDNNKMAIVKERFKKTYRQADLDKALTKKRIKNEVKLLKKSAGLGIKVPDVFKTDMDLGLIIMEYINDSMTTRDFIFELIKQHENEADKLHEELKTLASSIGNYIGTLHRNEIIHGDLTTSNVLLKKNTNTTNTGGNNNNEIYFIDFGLSSISHQLEDKAVDLYVLERALNSTHSKHAQFILDNIMESYCVSYGRHNEKVLERLEQVRLRGRKRSMIG